MVWEQSEWLRAWALEVRQTWAGILGLHPFHAEWSWGHYSLSYRLLTGKLMMLFVTYWFIMIITWINVYKEPDTVHNLYSIFKKCDASFYLICLRHILGSLLFYKRKFSLNNVHSPELGKEHNTVPIATHLRRAVPKQWGHIWSQSVWWSRFQQR